MIRLHQIRLPLEHPDEALERAARKKLDLGPEVPLRVEVARRNWDARKRGRVQLIYSLDVALGEDGSNGESAEAELLERFAGDGSVTAKPDEIYRYPAHAEAGFPHRGEHRPIVVGAGPCGFLAALSLAEMGLRPLIIERGQKVRQRTKDTFGFWRKRDFDPESNVQFGEGGAGTFSDGKLYTQIRDKRHLGRKVLHEFVEAEAPEEILWQGRPHVGTFRLVKMVTNLRAKIERLGGEFRFATRVTDLLIEKDAEGTRHVRGVVLQDGSELRTDHVVLALGHSARDTFAMLRDRGVHLIAKPFSIGVRIEHPQIQIDRWRFGRQAGHPKLGSADYRLVHHASNSRSAYSFCMCPGGTVVAATSEVGRVVTNGMSQYQRDERNANSGIVVGIETDDFPTDTRDGELGGVLAGVDLQRRIESAAFEAGGSNYDAPGQLLVDFVAGRPSKAFGSVEPSYTPGVAPTDLAEVLPDDAVQAMREAVPAFEKKMPGFALDDALMTGVETRTSAPIRIERGSDLQSLNTRGLFPAGEGAGYAGGILSAAIDGLKVAEAVALDMTGATGQSTSAH